MELIVLNTGYDLGAISKNVFTLRDLMPIVSTVLTAPGLRIWRPAFRFPPGRRTRFEVQIGKTARYTDKGLRRIW
jgi:hypothetical protein